VLHKEKLARQTAGETNGILLELAPFGHKHGRSLEPTNGQSSVQMRHHPATPSARRYNHAPVLMPVLSPHYFPRNVLICRVCVCCTAPLMRPTNVCFPCFGRVIILCSKQTLLPSLPHAFLTQHYGTLHFHYPTFLRGFAGCFHPAELIVILLRLVVPHFSVRIDFNHRTKSSVQRDTASSPQSLAHRVVSKSIPDLI
jgi:hypothetical protein